MRLFLKRLVSLLKWGSILVLAACASESVPPLTEVTPTNTVEIAASGVSLVDTLWTLVSFSKAGQEIPVLQGTNLTLGFQGNGQAGGSGGCNTFESRYEVQDGEISFHQLITTEMFCTAAGVMEQEQKYYNALQSANRFERSNDTLRIFYAGGQNVLNFSSTPAGPTIQPTS